MLELDDIAEVIAGAVREATAPLIERCAALEADRADLLDRVAELEARKIPDSSSDVDLIKVQLIELERVLPSIVVQHCDFTKAEIQPIFARIEALEQRELPISEKGDPGEPGPAGPPGEVDIVGVEEIISSSISEFLSAIPAPKDGKSVDMAEVKAMVDAAVAEIPPAKDGADCDMVAVKLLIAEEVAVAASTIPIPEKGEPGEQGPAGEVDVELVKSIISEEVSSAVSAIPLPEKGESGEQGPAGEVDVEIIKSIISEEVNSAVSAIPLPEKGEPGEPGKPGESGPSGEKGEPGSNGIDGKDGTGLADAIKDGDGNLVLILSDGRTKNIGSVIGRDGVDGINGKDGADGETFGLDDFDIVPLDDERSFKFCFTRGETMHSFEFGFPVVLDCGVWREDSAYVKGDGVTWAGSWWIAQRDAPGKPDTPDGGWRLAVKRGRDGKDYRAAV